MGWGGDWLGEEEGVVVVFGWGCWGGGGGAVAEAEAGGEVEEAVGVEVGRSKLCGWHCM